MDNDVGDKDSKMFPDELEDFYASHLTSCQLKLVEIWKNVNKMVPSDASSAPLVVFKGQPCGLLFTTAGFIMFIPNISNDVLNNAKIHQMFPFDGADAAMKNTFWL